MTRKLLIVGRGPSAYRKPIPEDDYELIVKLKICYLDNPHISKRCDIIVLYATELHKREHAHYDVNRHKDKIDHVLIFEPDEQRWTGHHKTDGMQIKKMDTKYLNQQSVEYGFRTYENNNKKGPFFSTGMATIIWFLKEYPEFEIDLIGFDNLVSNKIVGHFDSPHHKHTHNHDFGKEHKLLQTLLSKHSNLHVKTF